jgi:hypothetical protein
MWIRSEKIYKSVDIKELWGRKMSRLKELRKYVDKKLNEMPDADKWISAVSHLYGADLLSDLSS